MNTSWRVFGWEEGEGKEMVGAGFFLSGPAKMFSPPNGEKTRGEKIKHMVRKKCSRASGQGSMLRCFFFFFFPFHLDIHNFFFFFA